MIRKLSLSGVVMATLYSSTAFAADLPSRLPPRRFPTSRRSPGPASTSAAISALEEIGSSIRLAIFDAGTGQTTVTSSGIIGGGQVGYN